MLILITIFLSIISSLQILIFPLFKSFLYKYLTKPIPNINNLINIQLSKNCEKDIFKNADKNSLIAFICSKK